RLGRARFPLADAASARAGWRRDRRPHRGNPYRSRRGYVHAAILCRTPAQGGKTVSAARTRERQMIYELRIYHCMPGMLPALLRRFEDHTLRIWERHGIVQAGFWKVLVGENNHDLTYLLRWESMADREKRWNA